MPQAIDTIDPQLRFAGIVQVEIVILNDIFDNKRGNRGNGLFDLTKYTIGAMFKPLC